MNSLGSNGRRGRAPLLGLLFACAAACGGAAAVDPIGGPASPDGPARSDSPAAAAAPTAPSPAPKAPAMPTGPYTGLVGTTDVSILYPLPVAGASTDFVRPTAAGDHGELLPKDLYDAVLAGRPLERVTPLHPSGYAELGLVSLRLDPCSARGGAGCRGEVRLVFQALYQKSAGAEEDPVAGTAATDGGVHVIYDLPEAELVTMAKQILTLKAANGGLALHELAPHPILALQGLDGGFAKGLRAIVLEHLGGARVGRITFFDHNFDLDGDGWTFGVYDRAGATMVRGEIPFVNGPDLIVGGSPTNAPLATSSAATFASGGQIIEPPDSVRLLLAPDRPVAGSPQAGAMQPAFEAALRVQNPTLHTAESIDCASCHLAEGARRVGESVYALTSPNGFTHARSLAYKTESTSLTNLHAFGYLHRNVSIMQRTANESVLVAAAMEAKVK